MLPDETVNLHCSQPLVNYSIKTLQRPPSTSGDSSDQIGKCIKLTDDWWLTMYKISAIYSQEAASQRKYAFYATINKY